MRPARHIVSADDVPTGGRSLGSRLPPRLVSGRVRCGVCGCIGNSGCGGVLPLIPNSIPCRFTAVTRVRVSYGAPSFFRALAGPFRSSPIPFAGAVIDDDGINDIHLKLAAQEALKPGTAGLLLLIRRITAAP